MSIQAVSWVLEHAPARGLSRLVLISLANHANPWGASCHPSLALIAAEAGVSIPTARRAIDRLEADGEIVIQRGRGRGNSNRYVMTMQRTKEQAAALFEHPEMYNQRPNSRPEKGHPGVHKSGKERPISELGKESSETPKRVKTDEKRVTLGYTEPLTRTVKEPSASTPAPASAPAPPPARDAVPEATDAAPDYVSILGDDVAKLTGFLDEIDRGFGAGWVRNTLRQIERDVGPLPRDALRAGLELGAERLRRRVRAATPDKPIVNPQGLAIVMLTQAVQEQIA